MIAGLALIVRSVLFMFFGYGAITVFFSLVSVS